EREVINQRVPDVENPSEESLSYRLNYATTLARLARPAEALRVVDGILERVRRSEHHYVLAYTLLTKASALIQLERWDEAGAALSEVAPLSSEGIGNRTAAAQAESYWVRVALGRGDLASAHQHRDKSLELAGYHT